MARASYFRPCIEAMEGYVPGAQPRGRAYIKLNANENPYPPSPRVLEALHAAASDGLRLYPDAMATALREKALSIKWNLYLAQDDFAMAMGTCKAFSLLYPESPLVDNALMGIGKIFLKRREYKDAIQVFRPDRSNDHHSSPSSCINFCISSSSL